MPKKGDFKCTACGRTFKMAAHLGRHMSTLHGRPGRKAARPGRPAAAVIRSGGGGLPELVRDIQSYRDELGAQRMELDAQVARLDEVLAALGGSAPAKPAAPRRGRAAGGFRAGSLKTYVERVLGSSGAPMSVKNITAAVRKAGYKTKNKTLAKSVGNALADMRNVGKVSRGMFRLK
jgi:hypothetical protein